MDNLIKSRRRDERERESADHVIIMTGNGNQPCHASLLLPLLPLSLSLSSLSLELTDHGKEGNANSSTKLRVTPQKLHTTLITEAACQTQHRSCMAHQPQKLHATPTTEAACHTHHRSCMPHPSQKLLATHTPHEPHCRTHHRSYIVAPPTQ